MCQAPGAFPTVVEVRFCECRGRLTYQRGRAKLVDMTDEELNRRFDQLHEDVRDMQTEILRGLERFARGNFARMHRLEVSDDTR